MKANEIFIGAYVNALGKTRKVKSIVSKDTGIEVSFEGKNPVIVSLDEIEPVLLSDYFFEKNGFKKHIHKSDRARYNWAIIEKPTGACGQTCSNTGEKYIVFESGWLIIGIPEARIEIPVSYVHQIQHAFRLAGIEQEIIL